MPDTTAYKNGLLRVLLETPKPSDEITRLFNDETIPRLWHSYHYELLKLRGIQQAANWHPEGDVWNHMLLAVDACQEVIALEHLNDEQAAVVAVATLCHDLGKATTTEFIDGRWRSRGHAEAGVEPTRRLLIRIGFSADFIAKVENIVREHMFFATADGNNGRPSDEALKNLARRLRPATIYELVLVMECDQRGRAVPWEGFPDGELLLAQARALRIADGQA